MSYVAMAWIFPNDSAIHYVLPVFVADAKITISHNGANGLRSSSTLCPSMLARWWHHLNVRQHYVSSKSPNGSTGDKAAVYDCRYVFHVALLVVESSYSGKYEL